MGMNLIKRTTSLLLTLLNMLVNNVNKSNQINKYSRPQWLTVFSEITKTRNQIKKKYS